MTTSDITLVKETFHRVVPIADQLAPLFYARLFELDPQLRSLFAGDMAEQGRTLINVVALTVAALERPTVIVTLLHDLAGRQLGPGTKEEHYLTVGTAWMWTLEKGLGPDFTPAVHAAWTSVFTYVIHTLVQAQREGVVAA